MLGAAHIVHPYTRPSSDGGTVPSLVDPDQLFNTCNPDESLNFSESRLSLGMARVSIGYNTSANSMVGN